MAYRFLKFRRSAIARGISPSKFVFLMVKSFKNVKCLILSCNMEPCRMINSLLWTHIFVKELSKEMAATSTHYYTGIGPAKSPPSSTLQVT